ncbi:MAG: YraN family protein [Anaerolineales bacterium]|nr:YraN family protein [Anaerolineales bacterium]
MSDARVRLGRAGEALAAEKLTTLGYTIVARNFRCAAGEVDLITRLGPLWVFVEVRTRRGRAAGTPEESLTPRKRRHLVAAAQTYLQANDLRDVPWRIDLVAIEFTPQGALLRVDVVANAVTG